MCARSARKGAGGMSNRAEGRLAEGDTSATHRPSYAVLWREGEGPTFAGKVELRPSAVRFEGSAPQDGRLYVREFPYGDLDAVRIVRTPEDRLAEQPALVLERRTGAMIRVAAVNGLGLLRELAELLAALSSQAAETAQQFAVVLPLREGARGEACRLIGEGPPFDPALASLERHLVFLGEREAVFVFEGSGAPRSIRDLLSRPGVLKAALAWRPLLAGPPRVLEGIFSWTGRER